MIVKREGSTLTFTAESVKDVDTIDGIFAEWITPDGVETLCPNCLGEVLEGRKCPDCGTDLDEVNNGGV